jgi:hypothetical protein
MMTAATDHIQKRLKRFLPGYRFHQFNARRAANRNHCNPFKETLSISRITLSIIVVTIVVAATRFPAQPLQAQLSAQRVSSLSDPWIQMESRPLLYLRDKPVQVPNQFGELLR